MSHLGRSLIVEAQQWPIVTHIFGAPVFYGESTGARASKLLAFVNLPALKTLFSL